MMILFLPSVLSGIHLGRLNFKKQKGKRLQKPMKKGEDSTNGTVHCLWTVVGFRKFVP